MAAAHALGISRKSLDNILAREARGFFPSRRRGRSRRLSFAQLEQLAVTLILARDLRIPIARAFAIASEIVRSPSGEPTIGSLASIRFDRASLRGPLEAALAVALEEVAPRRRGRPPVAPRER